MRVRSYSPLPVLIGWVQNMDVRVWGLAWLQPFCVTINGGRICFNFFFGSVWLYANKTSFSMKWYSDTKMKQTTQQNYPNQIWDDIHAVNRKNLTHTTEHTRIQSYLCVRFAVLMLVTSPGSDVSSAPGRWRPKRSKWGVFGNTRIWLASGRNCRPRVYPPG